MAGVRRKKDPFAEEPGGLGSGTWRWPSELLNQFFFAGSELEVQGIDKHIFCMV